MNGAHRQAQPYHRGRFSRGWIPRLPSVFTSRTIANLLIRFCSLVCVNDHVPFLEAYLCFFCIGLEKLQNRSLQYQSIPILLLQTTLYHGKPLGTSGSVFSDSFSYKKYTDHQLVISLVGISNAR